MLIMFLKLIQPCSPTKGFMWPCHAALWLLRCLNVGTAPWALPAWSKRPPQGPGLWGQPAIPSKTPSQNPGKKMKNLMQMEEAKANMGWWGQGSPQLCQTLSSLGPMCGTWQPQTLWDKAENELKTTSLAWQPSVAQAVSPGLPAACHFGLGTSAFVTQERIAVNGFLSSEQPELFNFCSGWLH